MKIHLALLVLPGIAAFSCSKTDAPLPVDLLPVFDAAEINFHSPVFTADTTLPLNQDLPAGTSLSYSYSLLPVRFNLQQVGSDFSEIESAKLVFRVSIEPHGFSGTGSFTLYIGTLTDVYSDPAVVPLTGKKILPATFELSSSHSRLPYILELDEVFVGYRLVLEPLRLTSHQVSASGQIETFTAEIKGSKSLF